MDRFFDEWPEIKSAEFMPALDVYEKNNKVIVETPVAGIDPKKVEISVEDDNILVIKGKSEKKSEVDEKDYYRREVKYGSFYRAVSLPTRVKGTEAEASYKDGILKIEVPKVSDTKAKKLKVKFKK